MKLIVEVERLRGLLYRAWMTLSDIDPSEFHNGVRGPWGGPDEGEVLHGRFMDELAAEFPAKSDAIIYPEDPSDG